VKLDNVFEELSFDEEDYGDFTDRLDKALAELSLTRGSAEELMDAIRSYDVAELFNALFDNFEEFMTEAEKGQIIQRYLDTFDISELPWWAK